MGKETNKMKKLIKIALIALILTSCGSMLDLRRENVRKDVLERNPNWTQARIDHLKKYYDNKFYIGMSRDEVLFCLGVPNDINRTVSKDYYHEQWVYEYYNYPTSNYLYLYFENGILTSYQK